MLLFIESCFFREWFLISHPDEKNCYFDPTDQFIPDLEMTTLNKVLDNLVPPSFCTFFAAWK